MQKAIQLAKAATERHLEAERQEREADEARRLEAEAGLLHRQVAKVLENLGQVEECASIFGSTVRIHGVGELLFPNLPPHATNFVSLGLSDVSDAFVVVAVRQETNDLWAEIYSFEYSENGTNNNAWTNRLHFAPGDELERIRDIDAGVLAVKVGDSVVELAAARYEALRMGTTYSR